MAKHSLQIFGDFCAVGQAGRAGLNLILLCIWSRTRLCDCLFICHCLCLCHCLFVGHVMSHQLWPQSDPSLYLIKDTGLCFNLCRPNKLRLLIRKQIKSSKQSYSRPFKSHQFCWFALTVIKIIKTWYVNSGLDADYGMFWMWLWKHIAALIWWVIIDQIRRSFIFFLHLRGSVKCSWSNNILCTKTYVSGPAC